MKRREPRKPRNMMAKAMHSSSLFAPKTVPPKKGKGVIYSRKGRNAKGLSGPYLLAHFTLSVGHMVKALVA